MPTNLEQFEQLTSFVGRETELSETQQLLENAECRLVTLVGVGGSGKTRLAIQLARRQLPRFGHEAWFVNLQPLQSGKQIATAVMDAMEVAPSGRDAPIVQLCKYLQEKDMLLVLDNFEHIDAGAGILRQIIQDAPGVKLLVTSRQALRIPEEWLYPVHGLHVPQSHETENVTSRSAVALFVARARQVRPNFSLTANRASVVRICQLVDGLPLAIEMAASWIKTLRCAEIAAEIQQNLNFLSLNLHTGQERHNSMQAVFSQTWSHLSQAEKALFKRLSVFRGGFQRVAAEAITGATLPHLSSLVDKCLLRREVGGRYQIHELLRQYADARLDPSARETLAGQHCRYYCDYLAQRKLGMVERSQVQTSAEIEAELENIRIAWQFAIENKQLANLRKAIPAYFYFCQMGSRYMEMLDASSSAAALFSDTGDHKWLAQVLVYQGWMQIRVGRFEQAVDSLDRSKALFVEHQLAPVYGMGSHPIAPLIIAKVIQGNAARAVTLGEELKEITSATGDMHNQSFACYGLASAYLNKGDYQAALTHASRAVHLASELGNTWFGAYGYIELGNVHRALGHYADAERYYRQCLHIKQDFNDPEGFAVTANHLGEISLLQEDYASARRLYEQSFSLYQKMNDKGGLAAANRGLGQVAFKVGDAHLAAQYFRAALEIASQINFLPLQLSLLIDSGALLLKHNFVRRGVELLRVVQSHPASTTQQQEKAAELLASQASNSAGNPLPGLHPTTAALLADLRAFLPKPAAPKKPALIDPLTSRELDVLNLIGQGLSNPGIAERLVISVGTVKAHTNRIYGKLGVTNRIEALIKGQELALIDK